MAKLTVFITNLLLTLGFFFSKSIVDSFYHQKLFISSYFGRNSMTALFLLILTGALSTGVTVYITRTNEAPLSLFLMSPLGLFAGTAIFWWFHPDRTSPRYGGGDFFIIEMAMNFGFLLLGFITIAFIYSLIQKISK